MTQTRHCTICGIEFEVPFPSSRKWRCSPACAGIHNSIVRTKKEKRTCPICGKEFLAAPATKKRCCSIKCRGAFRRQNHTPKPPKPYVRKEKACLSCGTVFHSKGAAKWCKSCQKSGRREAARTYYKTQQYKEAHRRLAREWQKRNPAKMVASRLARHYPELLQILYECPCETNGNGKHHHHFDYARPYEVIKLCDSCHMKEEKRLRDLAAQAASNTHLSDVPVSNDGASLTRTSQQGNGDNAPDTVLSDAQVEPIREAAQTASEQPSLLAEMR